MTWEADCEDQILMNNVSYSLTRIAKANLTLQRIITTCIAESGLIDIGVSDDTYLS